MKLDWTKYFKEAKSVGSIENDHGSLFIVKVEDKHYWFIDDVFTSNEMEEIPKPLYLELLTFGNKKSV